MFDQEYDVIEMKTYRIDDRLYQNEVIAINLSNYKRVKIEFRTRLSMFTLSVEKELMNSYWRDDKIEIQRNMNGRFVHNHNLIKGENGELFTVTQID